MSKIFHIFFPYIKDPISYNLIRRARLTGCRRYLCLHFSYEIPKEENKASDLLPQPRSFHQSAARARNSSHAPEEHEGKMLGIAEQTAAAVSLPLRMFVDVVYC